MRLNLSRALWYILDDQGRPTPVADATAYFAWLKERQPEPPTMSFRLAVDEFDDGPVSSVSTIFTGLATTIDGTGVPFVFETAVFSRDDTVWTARYTSLTAAQAGHAAVVAAVRCGRHVPTALDAAVAPVQQGGAARSSELPTGEEG